MKHLCFPVKNKNKNYESFSCQRQSNTQEKFSRSFASWKGEMR